MSQNGQSISLVSPESSSSAGVSFEIVNETPAVPNSQSTPTYTWDIPGKNWHTPYIQENAYNSIGYATEQDAKKAWPNYTYKRDSDGKWRAYDKNGVLVATQLWQNKDLTSDQIKELEAGEDYKAWTEYVIEHMNDGTLGDYFTGLVVPNSTDGKAGQTAGIFQVDANNKFITDENGNYQIINKEYFDNMAQDDPRRYLYYTYDKNGIKTVSTDAAEIYRYLRNDGKHGFYHYTPGKKEVQPPKTEPPKTEPPAPKRRVLPEFNLYPEYKRQPWTDWRHITGIAANDLWNNKKQYDLELNKKVSLEEPKYEQGKVTNAYLERMLREKKANELRARAKDMMGSDLARNMSIMNGVEKQASVLDEQNLLSKSNEFNQTTQNLQAISNRNIAEGVRVRNANSEKLAALDNSKIAARQNYLQKRTALQDDFWNKLHASREKWTQTENLNKYRYDFQIANLKATDARNQASDDYARHANLETSDTFNRWFNALNASNNTTVLDGLDPNSYNNPKAVLDWIRAHPDDEVSKSLQASFNAEIERADQEYNRIYRRTQRDLDFTLASQPYLISGEALVRSPHRATVSPLYSKKGSRIVAIDDYRRAQDALSKQVRENSKMLERRLARAIGALDRETLIYLKAMFK